MITRKQYLADKTPGAFERYYRDIIAEAGGPEVFRLPFNLADVRKALEAGDEHLNTLGPAHRWDISLFPASVAKALRDRGDYPTAAGGVCINKAAALWRIEKEDQQCPTSP